MKLRRGDTSKNLKKNRILNELSSGGMNLSDLARKHKIHPVTLHKWKREMGKDKPENQADYQELIDENESLKSQIESLKKTLGEVAVEKQILQTTNDI